MAKNEMVKKNVIVEQKSRTSKYAKKGIKTGTDFAGYMGALMSDLIEGRITPQIANAACNAGGKLLKVVEMQYKYGKSFTKDDVNKDIVLIRDRGEERLEIGETNE